MKAKTQIEKVESHLKKFKKITSWEAISKYRITRLSAYIHKLRESMKIESKEVYPKKGNWYTVYTLKK
jgi:hypothetical protein